MFGLSGYATNLTTIVLEPGLDCLMGLEMMKVTEVSEATVSSNVN